MPSTRALLALAVIVLSLLSGTALASDASNAPAPNELGPRKFGASTATGQPAAVVRASPPAKVAPQVDLLDWSELWSFDFHSPPEAARRGQIAVRGPLIVVASAGEQQNTPDAWDGLFVIDGRSDRQRSDARDASVARVVRRLSTDAASGVALDGDYLVYAAAGNVVRTRLDGLLTWRAEVGSELSGYPALFDVNADGVKDALVGLVPEREDSAGRNVSILALDALTGRELWRAVKDLGAASSPNGDRVAGDPLGHELLLSIQPASDRRAATARFAQGMSSSFGREISIIAGGISIELAGEQGHRFVAASLNPGDIPSPFEADWHASAGIILPPVTAGSSILWGSWFADAWQSAIWLVQRPAEGASQAGTEAATSGACELWLTTADLAETPRRLVLPGPCGSLPSVGNVDADGVWDVVVVAGGRLRAISTHLRAEVGLALPRGDLSATGVLPAERASIESYANGLPVRDVRWWLRGTSSQRAEETSFAVVPAAASPAPERERSDGSVLLRDIGRPPQGPRANAIPDATTWPAELQKPSARSLVQGASRVAGVDAGAVLVCSPDCQRVPEPTGTVTHLTFQEDSGRLWALSAEGGLFSLESGGDSWQEASWAALPAGELGKDSRLQNPVEHLRALPGALAILRASSFSLLPLNGRSPSSPARTVLLHVSDIVQCGEHWFANQEGWLITPGGEDLEQWSRVPNHPGPVRGLGCSESGLLLTTAGGGRFTLTVPAPQNRGLVWLILGLAWVGLLTASILLVRPPRTKLDASAAVGRAWRVDAPLRRLEETAGSQRRLVEGMLDFIDNPGTHPPLTVAVCGPWGSGKSSLMGVLHDELKNTGRHVLVWFNAWRFHREPEITHAFYQSILDEFRRQASWPVRFKVVISRVRRAGASRVLGFVVSTVLALGALGLVALIAYGALLTEQTTLLSTVGLITTALVAVFGAWQRALNPILKVVNVDTGKVLEQLKGRLRFVRDLKSEFGTVFAGLGDALKLVVFVDDLDRCAPDRVADMLEALNVLAENGHTVLVMAVDPAAVERAVQVRFQDMVDIMHAQGAKEEARTFGARYVEKMVTVSVTVPELSALDVLERGRAREATESDRMLKPWYRRSFGALFPALLDRVPLVATGLAIVVLILPLLRLQVDFSKQAVSDLAKQLYAACKSVAQAPLGPAAPPPGAGVSATANALPPAAPSSSGTKSESAAAAASAGGAAVSRDSERGAKGPRLPIVALVQLPPQTSPRVTVPLPEPPIAAPGSEAPAAVFRRIVFRRLVLDGLALCGFLLAFAGFTALAARRRRAREARPVTQDSPEFSAALERAVHRLSPHPRTVIRFENLARFLYHLVRQAPAWKEGSEDQFFELLLSGWGASPIRANAAPEWLTREVDAWLRATAPERRANARGNVA